MNWEAHCVTFIQEVSLLADDIHDLKDEALVAENEDLLEMTELHEATLLRCIENRYNKDVIYVRFLLIL